MHISSLTHSVIIQIVAGSHRWQNFSFDNMQCQISIVFQVQTNWVQLHLKNVQHWAFSLLGLTKMVRTAALTECETTVMCQQSLARVMKD